MEAYYRNLKATEARNGSVNSADDSLSLTAMEAHYRNPKAIRAGKGSASGADNMNLTPMEAHYRNLQAMRAGKGSVRGDDTMSLTAMEAHYRNLKAIRAGKGAASGADNTDMMMMEAPSYDADDLSKWPEINLIQAASYDVGGRCKLPGNFVVIKPKTSSAQSTVHAEIIEKIPEEEAVCRFCYNAFKRKNVVMLTCNCNKNTLAHESCSHQNSMNCCGCAQEFQKLLVTLHLEPYSTQSREHENAVVSFLRRVARVQKRASLPHARATRE